MSGTNVAKVAGRAVSKFAGKVVVAVNPVDVLRDITNAVSDYKKVKAQEQTKRRGIEAWESVTLETVRAKRDIMLKYLEASFDERRNNFDLLFVALDRALTSNQTDQLAPILQSIILLSQESPFKALTNSESVQAFMVDRDTPVDF